ncbi:hypothetical protein CDAR_7061 [Caerostris darwini]|uniref:Uncharacterized protein n=1 Tax=Caerostris darwini TaxID=1538125 RepID=A0AAV4PHF1_9ARAC|nr:hypothetical protein CDAR_7061 [Caerostris darwini]
MVDPLTEYLQNTDKPSFPKSRHTQRETVGNSTDSTFHSGQRSLFTRINKAANHFITLRCIAGHESLNEPTRAARFRIYPPLLHSNCKHSARSKPEIVDNSCRQI